MAEKVKWVKKQCVALGLRRLDETKLAYAIAVLDQDGKPGKERYFQKIKKSAHVGGVYEVEMSEDDSTINVGSLTFLRPFEDHEQVAAWSVLSQADRAAVAAQRELKALDFESLAKMLAPLAWRYRRTDAIGQRAIEAVLLSALRRTL